MLFKEFLSLWCGDLIGWSLPTYFSESNFGKIFFLRYCGVSRYSNNVIIKSTSFDLGFMILSWNMCIFSTLNIDNALDNWKILKVLSISDLIPYKKESGIAISNLILL